jgi:hypothetical protein
LPHPKADDAPIASTVTKISSRILRFRMIRFLLHKRLIDPFTDEFSNWGRDEFGDRRGKIAYPNAHGH